MEGIHTAVTRPLYTSYLDEVHLSETNSIWDLPGVVEDITSDPCERHVPPLPAMEENAWNKQEFISILLTKDDAVRCNNSQPLECGLEE